MNLNDIQNALASHQELLNLAEEFVRFKEPNSRRGEVRISDSLIEEEINTACHCHPEYEWVCRGSVEEFSEWLKSRQPQD